MDKCKPCANLKKKQLQENSQDVQEENNPIPKPFLLEGIVDMKKSGGNGGNGGGDLEDGVEAEESFFEDPEFLISNFNIRDYATYHNTHNEYGWLNPNFEYNDFDTDPTTPSNDLQITDIEFAVAGRNSGTVAGRNSGAVNKITINPSKRFLENATDKSLFPKKARSLYFILNTSYRHEVKGSHWVGFYIFLGSDTEAPFFYYYNSAGVNKQTHDVQTPKGVIYIYNKILKQCFGETNIKDMYSITPNKQFPLYYSKDVIQRGNSACGVYSLYTGMLLLTQPNELPLSPLIITSDFIREKGLVSYSQKYLSSKKDTIVANIKFKDNMTKIGFIARYPIPDHVIRLYLFVLFNQ